MLAATSGRNHEVHEDRDDDDVRVIPFIARSGFLVGLADCG
jgi:hypothetical protein